LLLLFLLRCSSVAGYGSQQQRALSLSSPLSRIRPSQYCSHLMLMHFYFFLLIVIVSIIFIAAAAAFITAVIFYSVRIVPL
jgi:hypothetical protein